MATAKRHELTNQDIAILIAGAKQSDYPMTFLRVQKLAEGAVSGHSDREQGTGVDEVTTVVHIRPDADLEYRHLIMVLNAVKDAGFKRIKVHGTISR